jgi:hypothetical protein
MKQMITNFVEDAAEISFSCGKSIVDSFYPGSLADSCSEVIARPVEPSVERPDPNTAFDYVRKMVRNSSLSDWWLVG